MRLNQLVGRHVPKPSRFKPEMDLPPIKVVVTGAAGQIGNYLSHFIS
jgi:hypothetical protein